MLRSDFVDYLVASGLKKSACSTRAYWCRRVEEMFNVNLDLIVMDKENALDIIELIMSSPELTPKKQNNYPNAVRKYYKFKNGKELGTLKENSRR
jgi:hypothetical protein